MPFGPISASRPWVRSLRIFLGLMPLGFERLIERKYALPVILHADYGPAVLLRLFVKCGREGADLAVGQALRWPVSVFTHRVIVQHQHLQPRTRSGGGPFEHLLVAD